MFTFWLHLDSKVGLVSIDRYDMMWYDSQLSHDDSSQSDSTNSVRYDVLVYKFCDNISVFQPNLTWSVSYYSYKISKVFPNLRFVFPRWIYIYSWPPPCVFALHCTPTSISLPKAHIQVYINSICSHSHNTSVFIQKYQKWFVWLPVRLNIWVVK